jgi:hypothetical protein
MSLAWMPLRSPPPVRQVEGRHDAPWLRRHTDIRGVEEIRVVDLDRGVERLAKPEEIERGVFYTNFDGTSNGEWHDEAAG